MIYYKKAKRDRDKDIALLKEHNTKLMDELKQDIEDRSLAFEVVDEW